MRYGSEDALGDEVVDQRPDVGPARSKTSGSLPWILSARVDARDQALRGGLFIAGAAVELPRTVQAGEIYEFKRGFHLQGVHAVVSIA